MSIAIDNVFKSFVQRVYMALDLIGVTKVAWFANSCHIRFDLYTIPFVICLKW